jgi:hypothetical protein
MTTAGKVKAINIDSIRFTLDPIPRFDTSVRKMDDNQKDGLCTISASQLANTVPDRLNNAQPAAS